MAGGIATETSKVAVSGISASTADQDRRRFMLHPVAKRAIGLAALSGFLYFLLYIFSTDITHLAELTKQGDKIYFLVPVVIAMVFSLVHGFFTDLFWEALGFRAKR